MTQALLLFCRICILKVSWDLSSQKPLEDPYPPGDALSAWLPHSVTPWSCHEIPGNIKVSQIRHHVPFLFILQSMNFTALPKRAEKREGSAFAPTCVIPWIDSLVWKCSSYKNTMGKGREIHTKCGLILPLLLLFHPSEEMLVVHNKARLQWANLIFHTCLFICCKRSLCRSVDSLETDIKTGL